MQPGTSPQDLHTILNRFSNWSGKASGRNVRSEGVREIPYEEALRQLRNRRAAQGYGSMAALQSAPERCAAGLGTPGGEENPPVTVREAAAEKPVTPAVGTKRRKPPRPAEAKGPPAGVAAPSRRKAAAACGRQSDAEFRKVLAKSLAGKPAKPAGEDRALRVSVRISRAEEEELQKRASLAGLTVSAYLRKCALGIDSHAEERNSPLAASLRAEAPEDAADAVPDWLGAGEGLPQKKPAGDGRDEAEPAARGWLSRLRQRFLSSSTFEERA